LGFSPCGADEWNARQFAAEISGVAQAVLRVVQDGVGVVEDVPFDDRRVAIVGAELFERPVGDVVAAVGAVFGIGAEGKTLFANSVEDRLITSLLTVLMNE
jgi:hypothetical protein